MRNRYKIMFALIIIYAIFTAGREYQDDISFNEGVKHQIQAEKDSALYNFDKQQRKDKWRKHKHKPDTL